MGERKCLCPSPCPVNGWEECPISSLQDKLAEARELNKRAVYGCCEECGVVEELERLRDVAEPIAQRCAAAEAEVERWQKAHAAMEDAHTEAVLEVERLSWCLEEVIHLHNEHPESGSWSRAEIEARYPAPPAEEAQDT